MHIGQANYEAFAHTTFPPGAIQERNSTLGTSRSDIMSVLKTAVQPTGAGLWRLRGYSGGLKRSREMGSQWNE